MKLKFVIYFNEVSPNRGEQFTFAFAKAGNPWIDGIVTAFRFILASTINRELSADIHLVESLQLSPEDENTYRYGRFDRPLHMREQLTAARQKPIVIKKVEYR